MKTNKVAKVADAAALLSGKPEVAKRVRNAIRRNSMVSTMLRMRVEKGLTQEDIAKFLKCDSSKISRIESGDDLQLRWADVVGYARALGVNMSVIFDDSKAPASERIKQYVYRIDEDLKNLAQLAEVAGDAEISHGISEFYRQVLFNFLVRFKENAQKLQSIVKIPAVPTSNGCENNPSATCEKTEKLTPVLA